MWRYFGRRQPLCRAKVLLDPRQTVCFSVRLLNLFKRLKVVLLVETRIGEQQYGFLGAPRLQF